MPADVEHLVITALFHTETRPELVKAIVGDAPVNRPLTLPSARYERPLFVDRRKNRHPGCIGRFLRQ